MSTTNLARSPFERNPNHIRNGLKSYVHALHKWNISPTIEGPYCMVNEVHQRGSQAVLATLGKKVGGRAHVKGRVLAKKGDDGKTGKVPAKDIENNAEYLATVAVGSPAQKLALDFDTGSADLWVWSTELPKNVRNHTSGNKHTVFDPHKSSTFKKTSGSWKIQYGDGSGASGDVGTDNVNVGGLVVKHQVVELAKQLSAEFKQSPDDGLLGLSFGNINTVKPHPAKTLVENMIAQHDITEDQQLFTAYLGSTPPGRESQTGSNAVATAPATGDEPESFYTFGYIDKTATAGQTPSYASVDSSQGFWQFDSCSAQIGDRTVTRSGNTAIADTGTTLALVGDDLCKAVYAAIPGATLSAQQQGWVFPTSIDLSRIPRVQVAVGDALFTINPEELPFSDLGDGTYYGGIQSRGDLEFDILGDVFLRSVYAIFRFDGGQPRFGCTQRTSTCQKSG